MIRLLQRGLWCAILRKQMAPVFLGGRCVSTSIPGRRDGAVPAAAAGDRSASSRPFNRHLRDGDRPDLPDGDPRGDGRSAGSGSRGGRPAGRGIAGTAPGPAAGGGYEEAVRTMAWGKGAPRRDCRLRVDRTGDRPSAGCWPAALPSRPVQWRHRSRRTVGIGRVDRQGLLPADGRVPRALGEESIVDNRSHQGEGQSPSAMHPGEIVYSTHSVSAGIGPRASSAPLEIVHPPDDALSHPTEETTYLIDTVPGTPSYPLRRSMELRVVEAPMQVIVRPLDPGLDEPLEGRGPSLRPPDLRDFALAPHWTLRRRQRSSRSA